MRDEPTGSWNCFLGIITEQFGSVSHEEEQSANSLDAAKRRRSAGYPLDSE